MEGMNLAKLEAVVEKLLNNLQEMRQENAALQAKIEAKNSKIADLESQLKALTSNQEEVSSRVTSLLASIEDWEKSTGIASDEPEDIDTGRDESKGSSLFSLGE